LAQAGVLIRVALVMKVAEWKFTGKGGKGKPTADSTLRRSEPSSPSRSYIDVLKGTSPEKSAPQEDPDVGSRKGASSDGTPPKTFAHPKISKPKRSKGQKQQRKEDASVEMDPESTYLKGAESSTGLSSSASSVALSPDAVNANLPELHPVYRVHNWNVTAPPFEPKPMPRYFYSSEPAAPASWAGWWTSNSWQETWAPDEPRDLWEQAWTTVKMADGKIFAARHPLKENSVNRKAAEGDGTESAAAEPKGAAPGLAPVASVDNAENKPVSPEAAKSAD
jgi:hypothetical protein